VIVLLGADDDLAGGRGEAIHPGVTPVKTVGAQVVAQSLRHAVGRPDPVAARNSSNDD
jgi:hypothetical protein